MLTTSKQGGHRVCDLTFVLTQFPSTRDPLEFSWLSPADAHILQNSKGPPRVDRYCYWNPLTESVLSILPNPLLYTVKCSCFTGIPLDRPAFLGLMHVYSEVRKPHHVEKVFREMLSKRILPDETAYLVLIDSYRLAGLGRNCERLLEEMKVSLEVDVRS